jgi:hypothetical protein
MTTYLEILQHALGLDQYGRGYCYRSHYVAGLSDCVVCRELVVEGLMREGKAGPLTGGAPVFYVTRLGVSWVRENSPAPPKLSAGQKRYRAYLDEDSGLSFGEWLKS